mgnify:CR=1 FL=1
MKQARIYMKRWLGINERNKQLSTDTWYLNFANQLLSLIDESPLYSKKFEAEKVDAALSLAVYLQDAIAQSGGWKEFSNAYYRLYKSYLPFYTLTDEYLPDEINVEDISFIQWTLLSRYAIFEEDEIIIQNPHDSDLIEFSQKVYDVMDTAFEEAPICDEPSSPIWVMGLDLLEMPLVPLPEITPGMTLKKDVENCLSYSKGEPLLYFTTYDELRRFYVLLVINCKHNINHLSLTTDHYFYISIISSLHSVNFSTPSAVTTHEFSIPRGPTPGNTILGSRANTIPGSNSCFIRGASTGASLISKPMP